MTLPKSLRDTILTLLFCSAGFFAIWIAKSRVGMQQEAVFVAFLLLPLIVYVIVAGRLVEFKAFGAEAKFVDLANQSVEPASGTIQPSVEDIEIVAKQGMPELQKRKALLDETKPIILTLSLGNPDYQFSTLQKYVDVLAECPTFKGVVILNIDGTFAVYYPSRSLSTILRSTEGLMFVEKIKSSKVDELRRYPGSIKRTVTKQSSNLEALKEMTLQNADTLVVTNSDNKVSGVLERQQLISKLLLAMAK
jgi:hypothetical protein